MGSQSFSLNWSNHKSNMSRAFQQLFTAKAFVDVTIVCDGLSLKAHKIVLSASSPLFRRLLLENPCQHPIVIMTDITYSDMEALLGFMYRGEIDVTEEKLSHFLQTAEKLKIKGLSSSDSSRSLSKRSTPSKQNISISNCHYLDATATEPNSTSNADFEELSEHSDNSLDLSNCQQATSSVKDDASVQNTYVDSVYANDPCLRNGSSDYSMPVNQLCATEFAKSTISCLRHWEGLTSGNPSCIQNQKNNLNTSVPQELSSGKENIPVGSDEDNPQDQIFPSSVVQPTMERPIEDLSLSKTEQAEEEETFEFNNEDDFDSSSPNTAETKQSEDEKIDNAENVLPVAEEPQSLGKNRDGPLAQYSDSKEPREYNPYLTCDVCKKGFEDLKRLCLHKRSHNCEPGPFTCSTCGKIFALKSRFRCHLRTHSGRRPFRCGICTRAFMRNEHLKDHMRIHSGEKPFSCTICEKKFITKGHLTIHNRSHTGEKPYTCDFCPKKFVKSSDLMTHLRAHTGERPYVCGLCGKSYARTSNLKMHASRAHSAEHQPLLDCL